MLEMYLCTEFVVLCSSIWNWKEEETVLCNGSLLFAHKINNVVQGNHGSSILACGFVGQ